METNEKKIRTNKHTLDTPIGCMEMGMGMREREIEKRTSKICTYVHAKLKSMHVLYVEHERSNTNDLTVSVKMNETKRKKKQHKILYE